MSRGPEVGLTEVLGVEGVVLHGPGRAGTSLALWMRAAGLPTCAVRGGGAASQAAAVGLLQPKAAASDAPVLWLLGVPDQALEGVADELAKAAPPPGSLVLHLAGSRGRDLLAPLAAKGLRTAAWHPLHPFPSREPATPGLDGAAVAIEATPGADFQGLEALARALGGQPFALSAEGRAAYHLGASALGNGLHGVFDLALRAFDAAGCPAEVARPALARLARAALEAAEAEGPARALTGPVVRGDQSTLAQHFEALATNDDDRDLYRHLCEALVRLAARRPDGDRAAALRGFLDGQR